MDLYRNDCRYCRRYSEACGRLHSSEDRADWGRDERAAADISPRENQPTLVIRIESEAGQYLQSVLSREALVYKISFDKRRDGGGSDAVAIKINEGMWTHAMQTGADW